MKKVLVAVAFLMGLGSFSAFAVESVNTVTVVCQEAKFAKVEIKDLPEAVTQAIEKASPGATIKEAFVSEKTEGKQYKVIFTSSDGKESTSVYNEKGEEIK